MNGREFAYKKCRYPTCTELFKPVNETNRYCKPHVISAQQDGKVSYYIKPTRKNTPKLNDLFSFVQNGVDEEFVKQLAALLPEKLSKDKENEADPWGGKGHEWMFL